MRARFGHNKFDQLDFKGLVLRGGEIMVEDFVENEFTNITIYRDIYRGSAAGIELLTSDVPGYPFVDHARRNQFYRCDTAIRIGAYSPFL